MIKWPKAVLGEYIQECSIRNKSCLDIPVYSVTNSNGFCKDYFSKEVASKNKSTYKIVKRGCFAYNPSRINVGSVDWLRTEEMVIVSPLYNVFSVKDEIHPQYLYYFLRSPIGLYYIKKKATGSVRDNLKFSALCEFSIPLPPYSVQKDISEHLDRANYGIKLCDELISKCNMLINARFYELFGDNSYPEVKAGEVCDFITKGTTPPSKEIFEEYSDGRIPYLKVYNLSFDGELLFEEAPQFISKGTHDGALARSKVYPNDVLMNIVEPPLGKFSLVPSDYPEWNINQAIAIFRAQERVLPGFLLTALMQPSVLRPFIDLAVGIRQQNLSLEQCRNLSFPLPPIDEQRKFVAYTEGIDEAKTKILTIRNKLESVKTSLMQDYFA